MRIVNAKMKLDKKAIAKILKRKVSARALSAPPRLVIEKEVPSKVLDCYCLVCKRRHASIDQASCTTFD